MVAAEDPWRPFRSRRGRVVAFTAAAGFALAMTVVALLIPEARAEARGGFHLADRLALVAFGLAVGLFLLQFGLVRATPSPEGLVVRNLFRRHRLDWAQIVSVQFGQNHPWAALELADTEHVPVMAIQRADGARGLAEARRLATMVAVHGSAAEPDRPAG